MSNLGKSMFGVNIRNEKIIILAQGILGDMLTMTPVLRELRRAFPNAYITAVVDPIGAEVLLGSCDIDNIYITNRSRKNKIKYLFLKFRFAFFVCIYGASLYIDLYGGSSSVLFSRFSLANRKIIISGSRIIIKGDLFKSRKELNFPNQHHLSVSYQRVLGYLCKGNINLSVKPSIDTSGRFLKPEEGVYLSSMAIGRDHLLISIGAGDPRKIPDIEQLARVISEFSLKNDMIPTVLTNPGLESLSQQFYELIAKKCKSKLLKRLSIKGVVRVLKDVRFAVVPDSGLLHLANACNTPFIGIFVFTPPKEVEPDGGIYEMVYRPSADQKPYRDKGLCYADPNIDDAELLGACERILSRVKKNETLV